MDPTHVVSLPPPLGDRTLRLLGNESGNDLVHSREHTYALVLDGMYVGFYIVGKVNSYLLLLHLFEDFRGRGIGRVVVERLIEEFPALNFHAAPSAYAFWRKMGFVTKSGREPSGHGCVEMVYISEQRRK